jgi:hypothetical protein
MKNPFSQVLREPHIAPLTDFVNRLRAAKPEADAMKESQALQVARKPASGLEPEAS